MSSTHPDHARVLADAKRSGRAARIARIRRRLTCGTVAVFAACWAAVFGTYASSPSAGGDVSAGSNRTASPATPIAPAEALDDDGELQTLDRSQPVAVPSTAPVPLTTSQS